MNKVKSRFIISLIAFISIVSIFSSKIVFAKDVTDTAVSESHISNSAKISYNENWITGTGSSGGAVRITFNDLKNDWFLLCSQRGQHLSEGYYKVKEHKIATPKAAYILNKSMENTGDYYSPIQQAWWTTSEGSENVTTNEGENNLSRVAKAYEDFVKAIANNVDDTSSYKELTHTYDDGSQATIKFPEIDSKKLESAVSLKSLDDNGNEITATVSFDQDRQKYLIGPFVTNYKEYSTVETNANGEKQEVKFGAIQNLKIYTDASAEPVADNQWRFVLSQGNYQESSRYPESNEKFYIELDYIDNATKVTGIDLQYKYLVAGAEYQLLAGNYTEADATKNAQELAFVDKAAAWYETINIGANFKNAESKHGSIIVQKHAIDENGKELSSNEIKDLFGEDQWFDFKVKVTHATGDVEQDVVTVKAGDYGQTREFYWDADEANPTYEVTEVTPSNGWSIESISGGSGTLRESQAVGKGVNYVHANNKLKKYSEKISLTKKRSGNTDTEENFYFDVKVTTPNGEEHYEEAHITIEKGKEVGNTWVSQEYVWAGDKKPTYAITENMNKGDASKYPNTAITPDKGILDGSQAIFDVNALNYGLAHEKTITLEKQLAEGQITDQEFKFKVTVNGVRNTENGKFEKEIIVKAGKVEELGPFVWNDGDAEPTYTIEEISDNEVKNISIEVTGDDNAKKSNNKVEGTLSDDGNTPGMKIKFVNNMVEHSGGVKVVKEIETTEKISKETLEAEGKKFEFEVVIEGTFEYNGTKYSNQKLPIRESLPNNGKWEFEVSGIKWWGSKAPTFTVNEINMPTGWRTKSITYTDTENNASSEGLSLIDGKVIEAKVINELPKETIYDLTMSMGGIVWVDGILDSKNTADNGYYSTPNGVYDEGETLKENAEVTVYKVIFDASGNEVSRTVAMAYKDAENNAMEFPIITKTDGRWDVPRISVPAFTDEEKSAGYTVEAGYKTAYDVTFEYDGQTYEPTEFLSYKLGSDGTKTKNEGSNLDKSQEFKNTKTSQRYQYSKDSFAVLNENDTSKLIAEVSGKTEIDAGGNTTGIATLVDGTQVEVQYTSDNAGVGYPTVSKLKTTNDEGRVLDLFKAKASTLNGNLAFPIKSDDYNGSSLVNHDVYVDENGIHETYKFVAIYDYCLNINLGLKERAAVDVGLTKNLDNAKVVVNEKMYEYKYSGAFDLTETKTDTLQKDIFVGNSEEKIEYTLGLYKSDYYYRAEMYNANNKDLYSSLDTFYKTLGKVGLKDSEMDVYLTYKLKLQNGSEDYSVKVNSIDDYFDSSFNLVTADESKYLKTKTVGKNKVETEINALETVANASDYSDKWSIVQTEIAGSDGVNYNKMTANNLDIMLAPGESKEIIVTFKIDKSKDENGVENSIKLGQKCNVAEIASYSTYYKDTTNYAGKIDRDSAPGNVDIKGKNEKAWYEDDTFAAPRLYVNLCTQDRTVNGIAWEDNSKDKNTEQPDERYNQYVGDGVKQNDEKTIAGLTTQLVEKVMVQDATDKTKYIEYDYIWPTNEKLDCLNGKTIEELTGFNSTVESNDKGEYSFSGVTAGDYVVRFTYGDKEIETADYSEASIYNGQDFKSSRLKSELKDATDSKFVEAGKYLDIDKLNASEEHKNTAADSEVRRMAVVSNSREIDYNKGAVLASAMSQKDLEKLYTADEISALRKELMDKYSMYADTAKLDMNIELSSYEVNNKAYRYDVKNVDCALEERPSTKLTLDKEIEEITLTTSDGNVIMDAKYNIEYNDIDDAGNIKATVTLDTANSYGVDNLQALNRDEATNQGFRYINVDSKILEGTTINVKYKFTVFSTGEVDRTRRLNEDMTTDEINKNLGTLRDSLAEYKKTGENKLVNANNAYMGEYVGSIYYYGKDGDTADDVVTSTVRQLVDYVDNDATFSSMMNASSNTSWSNITAEELQNIVKSDIVQDGKVVDSDGISYETENRNNLITSIDNVDENSILNNKEFIKKLVPYNAVVNNSEIKYGYQASMNLTVTRYVGADSGDLQIDNIAEIIRYDNTVGRRDEKTIPGNYNPADKLEKDLSLITNGYVSELMKYERDTSATEVITLAPPTGTGLMTWKLQVIGSITAGLAIVAGGIVLIKKKILK